jgi:hypothetical protein
VAPRIGLLLLLLVTPLAAAADESKAARLEDVRSIDAIIAALYDVISGPKGAARDFDRMRSLFAPGARLIPVRTNPDGGAQARPLDLEEFIQLAGPAFDREGFFESEIHRQTQAFANMAHVFSTYESRRAKDDPPFTRGINSIQLLKDGDRWWVVTIYWDSERTGTPIPPEYLPKDETP